MPTDFGQLIDLIFMNTGIHYFQCTYEYEILNESLTEPNFGVYQKNFILKCTNCIMLNS